MYVTGTTDLRVYQLAVVAGGGQSGALALENPRIGKQRTDYVFGRDEVIAAADQVHPRVGATLISGSFLAVEPAYLATFAFRALPDAGGTFEIDLRSDDSAFLRDSSRGLILHQMDDPASITAPVAELIQDEEKAAR